MSGKTDLEGKVAVVSGGGRGIGRAICLALAGQGADVVIADIHADTASETVAMVQELSRRAGGRGALLSLKGGSDMFYQVVGPSGSTFQNQRQRRLSRPDEHGNNRRLG